MLLRRLYLTPGVYAPAMLQVPDLPSRMMSVDLFWDAIYCSGFPQYTPENKGPYVVYQLCFGKWIKVTCEKTLKWYNDAQWIECEDSYTMLLDQW
jgi:hypothetical protein